MPQNGLNRNILFKFPGANEPGGQAGGGNKPGRGYVEYKKDRAGSGKLGLLLHEEHDRAFH